MTDEKSKWYPGKYLGVKKSNHSKGESIDSQPVDLISTSNCNLPIESNEQHDSRNENHIEIYRYEETEQTKDSKKWYPGKYLGVKKINSFSKKEIDESTPEESKILSKDSLAEESEEIISDTIVDGDILLERNEENEKQTKESTKWYPGKYIGLKKKRQQNHELKMEPVVSNNEVQFNSEKRNRSWYPGKYAVKWLGTRSNSTSFESNSSRLATKEVISIDGECIGQVTVKVHASSCCSWSTPFVTFQMLTDRSAYLSSEKVPLLSDETLQIQQDIVSEALFFIDVSTDIELTFIDGDNDYGVVIIPLSNLLSITGSTSIPISKKWFHIYPAHTSEQFLTNHKFHSNCGMIRKSIGYVCLSITATLNSPRKWWLPLYLLPIPDLSTDTGNPISIWEDSDNTSLLDQRLERILFTPNILNRFQTIPEKLFLLMVYIKLIELIH